MTRAPAPLPLRPMATMCELVATAVRAASHHVAEGSRRNARQALEVRHQLAREGAEALATVPVSPAARAAVAVPGTHQERSAG